jgi:hypothetical protein
MPGLAPAFLLIFSFADRTVIHDNTLIDHNVYNNVALAAFCDGRITEVISVCPWQITDRGSSGPGDSGVPGRIISRAL